MFLLIFGWDRQQVKKYASSISKKCPRCGNERLWDLVDISSWMTVFFVPVAAHDHDYILACPICGEREELTEKEFERLKAAGE